MAKVGVARVAQNTHMMKLILMFAKKIAFCYTFRNEI